MKAAKTTKPAVETPKVAHAKHFYAVGRRKTAVAQATLSSGDGTITVNQLPLEGYFMTASLQHIVKQPLATLGQEKKLNVRAKVHGGGIHAQAEGLRHAIARAIIALDPESRRTLKKLGFLTRDPRVKERKKPGLKRARRAPQFSKR
ncbi:MAG: 30S ribosomal protein S9 [Candidatus Doudnabacteria bacterium RIFCSPLOWO2_01_FULL_44_21]|uniref:Small ribosomal subunit protein uS9 n=1 Tax=Candidatus Doudnabacteria bacterium RIFCSPLOWO2_01_FULL_44_21 TaxID=1817841 RepID=A0A1F5PXQ4_9BACT|nr:MAG: 30S ribosomal protein S9 [Candidatus Doudnabacteria bacterium RIFCSPHIGHO2_02_FULL_43_13b]OGE94689.1 MAG: 30S ribosomal protein S9 [Candidatus Doudnabacteria bacterium RIFCSPLOWO2_01_FULL_44_21]